MSATSAASRLPETSTASTTPRRPRRYPSTYTEPTSPASDPVPGASTTDDLANPTKEPSGRLGEACLEVAQLDGLVEHIAALVVVERVDGDLLRAGVRVVGRVHRRWRADLVHQRDREQRRVLRQRGEHRHVEVRQRMEHPLDVVAMDRQVLVELGVRLGGRHLDGAAEVGQERDVAEHRGQVVAQAADGDGHGATLAASGDGNAAWIGAGE